ncbi:capsule assembly Wzi family protein [Cognataquiflexum rubidum]|uniref:capsule assembly Wzi family protein n=1 Tax=Cognataquiflexum rubidum TaxID=2922273 RepID=UPI001F1422CC|nr:capsule assembly Wzi family protein [Cognataquiflexum rubidum]MCH6236631.1 capsule assembly Wzi family protein [Cognataquiflexum rubidum]
MAQNLFSNNLQFQDYLRREQLSKGFDTLNASFNHRPFQNKQLDSFLTPVFINNQEKVLKNIALSILPFYQTFQLNSNRPYGWGDGPMIPSSGLQSYSSTGFFAKVSILNIQIQPELVFAQNSSFKGFGNNRSDREYREMFFTYNISDSPERFGDGGYSKISLGQSKVSLELGAFELGASTQNIWWGPGQFNSLIFSNNAQGFPHLTLNTTKPAKTFLGNFEGQVIVGRLENSGFAPTQFGDLNDKYFRPFTGDWRYLNGITISYNPKWIPGLFVGFSRTFQQFNKSRINEFRDYFPVFDAFQKVKVGFDKDADGKDQQASVFARFVATKAKAEIYFEYGRRDHAYNWREAILNPEHARAYLFGFIKLFDLNNQRKMIQLRGEVTHQQESINTIIRNSGDGLSWHTHTRARGFSNFGQPLGVGIGTGANVQALEISLVENFNKFGVLFERLENNQDFYYRAFGQQNEHKPWIDLSIGFLFDKEWNNLLLSSKLQLINGVNYQWQLHPNSTPEFPKGQNLFSVHAQTSIIYFFNNPKSKHD